MEKSALKYLRNCFLLLIPILLWNIFLAGYLPAGYQPDFFWRDIPSSLASTENVLRIIVMGIPVIMQLSVRTRIEKAGLWIYLIGTIIYFSSWLAVILSPESAWSTSAIGFTAPAYTSVFWLIGIGLIGHKSFFPIRRLTAIYLVLTLAFGLVHTLHAYLVFVRL